MYMISTLINLLLVTRLDGTGSYVASVTLGSVSLVNSGVYLSITTMSSVDTFIHTQVCTQTPEAYAFPYQVCGLSMPALLHRRHKSVSRLFRQGRQGKVPDLQIDANVYGCRHSFVGSLCVSKYCYLQ